MNLRIFSPKREREEDRRIDRLTAIVNVALRFGSGAIHSSAVYSLSFSALVLAPLLSPAGQLSQQRSAIARDRYIERPEGSDAIKRGAIKPREDVTFFASARRREKSRD